MSSLEGVHPNSAFLQSGPLAGKLQFAWDSTSIGALKTCPRKYYYSIVLGYEPRQRSVHLTFGILYHGAMEQYDHARARGEDHETALNIAVKWCLVNTWSDGKPWVSEDANKNRYTLLRSVVWYLDQYENDALETVILENGKPAVELSFRFETTYKCPTGEPYLLSGHLDKLAKLGDQIYVVDHKTSKHQLDPRFFQGFSPGNQFTLYTLAARVVYKTQASGVICNGAQIAVTFSRFQRGPIERSPFQLDEWYYDLGLLLKSAELYATLNHWPLNEMSCGNYGGCEFREVCSKKSQKAREDWLATSFVRRTWDPLVARGDI